MPVRDDERPVVVGYDDSTESRRALRWALVEARLRFLPLLLCHAWQWPYPMLSVTSETTAVLRRMGSHVLETGLALAHDLAPACRCAVSWWRGRRRRPWWACRVRPS